MFRVSGGPRLVPRGRRPQGLEQPQSIRSVVSANALVPALRDAVGDQAAAAEHQHRAPAAVVPPAPDQLLPGADTVVHEPDIIVFAVQRRIRPPGTAQAEDVLALVHVSVGRHMMTANFAIIWRCTVSAKVDRPPPLRFQGLTLLLLAGSTPVTAASPRSARCTLGGHLPRARSGTFAYGSKWYLNSGNICSAPQHPPRCHDRAHGLAIPGTGPCSGAS